MFNLDLQQKHQFKHHKTGLGFKIWCLGAVCYAAGLLASGNVLAETEFQPVAVGASLSQSHFLEQLALDTRGLHEKVLVESINLMVNKFEYRPEDPSQENLDHWATPYETFKNRGGDCEDLQLPSTMP